VDLGAAMGLNLVTMLDPPKHRLDRPGTLLGCQRLGRDAVAERGVGLPQPRPGQLGVLEHFGSTGLDPKLPDRPIGLPGMACSRLTFLRAGRGVNGEIGPAAEIG
jgi:hypothetical protein